MVVAVIRGTRNNGGTLKVAMDTNHPTWEHPKSTLLVTWDALDPARHV